MERIIYFQKTSPYPNDFTKRCSLNGIEIDENFLTLEGRDIKSIGVEGNYIVVTLYNGTKIRGDIASVYGGYHAGNGINQEKLENEKIIETDASLITTTQDINVIGMSFGSYEDGSVIPAGTSVQEIIKNLVERVFDVTPVKPVANIVVTANGEALKSGYDIGTTLHLVLSAQQTSDSYGWFVGPEEWPDQSTGSCVPPRKQSAECPTTMVEYYVNHTYVGQAPLGTTFEYDLILTESAGEGNYDIGAVFVYGNSEAQAKKSDGSNSSVTIEAGRTDEVFVSFVSGYSYFYGYLETKPYALYEEDLGYRNSIPDQSTLESLNFSRGFCDKDNDNVIASMWSSDEKPALALVLPHDYRYIKYTENSFQAPVVVSEKWPEYNTFTYTTGDINTTYHVYVLHSLKSIQYKKITFGRDV